MERWRQPKAIVVVRTLVRLSHALSRPFDDEDLGPRIVPVIAHKGVVVDLVALKDAGGWRTIKDHIFADDDILGAGTAPAYDAARRVAVPAQLRSIVAAHDAIDGVALDDDAGCAFEVYGVLAVAVDEVSADDGTNVRDVGCPETVDCAINPFFALLRLALVIRVEGFVFTVLSLMGNHQFECYFWGRPHSSGEDLQPMVVVLMLPDCVWP